MPYDLATELPGSAEVREYLIARVGLDHLDRRLALERRREYVHTTNKRPFMTKVNSSRALARFCLGCCGLYARGRRNALRIGVTHHQVAIENLPPALDGYTVLHLSDLHLECMDELADTLAEVIDPLRPDVTVITGDIRFRSFGPYQPSLDAMALVMPAIHSDCYAVLGNHDSIRMVPGLEAMGVQVLMNESSGLFKNGQTLWLSGVDDTSDYHCDDIELAASGRQSASPSILLAHSPERISKAVASDFDLYLCGHTHGGQICLPGGKPIRRNTVEKWDFCCGSWHVKSNKGGMHGFTSKGVGTTLIEARFNCFPEVIMLTLTCCN